MAVLAVLSIPSKGVLIDPIVCGHCAEWSGGGLDLPIT